MVLGIQVCPPINHQSPLLASLANLGFYLQLTLLRDASMHVAVVTLNWVLVFLNHGYPKHQIFGV